MRIVHIQDYFHPMLGYQETFLPREQAKLGHEVYVVTSDRYKPLVYDNNRNLFGERIVGARFSIEEGVKVWRLKTLFEIPHEIWMLGLERKIRELKPDVVIVHGIVNSSALRIARLKKKLGNFRLIYDDHMTFEASRSKFKMLYPLFKWMFSSLIQKTADALVGVSNTSKMFMHKKYGIPLEQIIVIPLGADDESFRFNATTRREVRSELSLSGGDIVFVYAGKIIPVKGPHLLVEAGVKLMRSYDNLKVILVGNGRQDYVEGMKQHIKREGLEDRFIWHDAVQNKDLSKLYSASDVAVWPREASLSMLEAMACGLPVIISDSSEVAERVGRNNGLTYRGNDTSSLAQQMEKLLDPGLIMKMGRNGRKFVEEECSWRVIAKQFIELAIKPREK